MTRTANTKDAVVSKVIMLSMFVAFFANVATALKNPTQVSTGKYHTCALDDVGVKCWGSNGYGQTSVPALINPTQISTGRYHTCALDDVGVKCWWNEGSGQMIVPALTNPTQISAGHYHTCALDDVGVKCWGGNNYVQTDVQK